jgi:hypothetical protein
MTYTNDSAAPQSPIVTTSGIAADKLFEDILDNIWSDDVDGADLADQFVDRATTVYAEPARISKGAHVKFDVNAAQTLGELLKAVATFAAGGVKALANQYTDAARLLISQMKH